MNGETDAGRPRERSACHFARSALSGRSDQPGPPGRLRHRREYLAVQKTGTRLATPGFVLQVGDAGVAGKKPATKRSQGTGESIRIGYTVSRKVGGAVERNRVKRRLRELGRLVLSLQAEPGRDYVLIGRRGALHRPFGQMALDMEKALGKLGLRRAKTDGDHDR